VAKSLPPTDQIDARYAKRLIEESQGVKAAPKAKAAHPRKHIPRAGENAAELAKANAEKPINTTFADEDAAAGALEEVLKKNEAALRNLKSGQTEAVEGRLPLKDVKGWRSVYGANPLPATFSKVYFKFKNVNGKLILQTFTPEE